MGETQAGGAEADAQAPGGAAQDGCSWDKEEELLEARRLAQTWRSEVSVALPRETLKQGRQTSWEGGT